MSIWKCPRALVITSALNRIRKAARLFVMAPRFGLNQRKSDCRQSFTDIKTTCNYAFFGSQVTGDVRAQEKPGNAKTFRFGNINEFYSKITGLVSLLSTHHLLASYTQIGRAIDLVFLKISQFSRGATLPEFDRIGHDT